MDFKKVLQVLSTQFEQHGISYALIGGFALGLRGVHRATLDIDMLDIHRLLELHKNNIDWDKLKSYFALFKMEDDFEELRNRFG